MPTDVTYRTSNGFVIQHDPNLTPVIIYTDDLDGENFYPGTSVNDSNNRCYVVVNAQALHGRVVRVELLPVQPQPNEV